MNINKNNIKIMMFILIGIIALGIGYAGISGIILRINSTSSASVSQNNFKVYFTGTPSITSGYGTAIIDSNDNKIARIDVSGLSKKNDQTVATYTVINKSIGIDANVNLNIDNTNKEYFEVTSSITDNKLSPNETATVTITVKMIKTPITNTVSSTITGTLVASVPGTAVDPVDLSGEYKMFYFGNPNNGDTLSSTKYSELNKDVFIAETYDNEYEICILLNNEPSCYGFNDIYEMRNKAAEKFSYCYQDSNNEVVCNGIYDGFTKYTNGYEDEYHQEHYCSFSEDGVACSHVKQQHMAWCGGDSLSPPGNQIPQQPGTVCEPASPTGDTCYATNYSEFDCATDSD